MSSQFLPKFDDFDERTVYESYEKAVVNPDTLNFIIDFDSKTARAARNIDHQYVANLLLAKKVGDESTRWINIWGPERQKDVVKTLAGHYGFSPRLLGLMCSDPLKPVPAIVTPHRGPIQGMMNHHRQSALRTHAPDLEGHTEMINSPTVNPAGLDLNHYSIVDEVWHFSSVDWGPKYLCIGYNWLYNTHGPSIDRTEPAGHSHRLPSGTRQWAWLILCSDATVVSIYENPYPHQQGPLSSEDKFNLSIIRANLLNVLRQLSKANDGSRMQNPIMTLPIRSSLLHRNSHAPYIVPLDVPSLLLYYLFDDWYTSYSLVARKEHRYGERLEILRESMFEKAQLGQINQLHDIGRQLAVLKRLYQSYALIIERVLERQKPVDASIMREHSLSSGQDTQRPTGGQPPATKEFTVANDRSLGVPLSPAAIVRFERLKDRIGLYALSEIQGCLEEKNSMVSLSFNLIALKESQAVERLTRITILLAKLTILFLPVSLMTAYFSVQITDLQTSYTYKTYWTCFGVIMAASLLFLVVFGKLSGTLEGRPIYKSMTETFTDATKLAFGSRRGRKTD
ncbi:hypothetical protein MMC12_002680 [Toensbergia leucococca]|nr:hypothetical protein [Toensbergia leucococca]